MATQSTSVNLAEKFRVIQDQWSPRIVAQVNDYHVKIAKVEGEFVWHSHSETDEMFLVHRGELTIELPGDSVKLGPGELYVVPKGTEHKPVASEECEIVMFELAGTVNTGEAGGALTVNDTPWV